MSKNDNKSSGCGCFLAFIALIMLALIITIVVLYSMNPTKLQEAITTVSDKIQVLIDGIDKKTVVPDNIEFPEKETLTEAQKYYYYDQLSDTGKRIYLTIENNVEKIKDGEDNIPLPPSLNELAQKNEDGKELIAKEFQNAWDAFISDRSEYFYIDSSKVCLVTKMTTKANKTSYEFFIGKGDNKNYFIDEFNSKEQVEKAIKEVESVKMTL